jgi:hypothetical protein
MLPSFVALNSVEMLRDGGSLCASFQGQDSCEYWLLLRIKLAEVDLNMTERLGYDTPVLLDRVTQLETQLTWEHAEAILGQAQRLQQRRNYEQAYEYMAQAISSHGELPDGVERSLGPRMKSHL